MEGLEELALSIALDIEPHDPPKGMGERLFAKIEAPRSRPASIVALPAAKAGAKVGKFKLASGIWAKGAAVAGAVLLAAYGATLYENQSPTGAGSAPTKTAGVAREDKTQQSNHAPTAIAKHDKQTKPTNKAKTNVAHQEGAYNNHRNDSVNENGGASGSEEGRGGHSTSSNAGDHGNHGNHGTHANRSNHGSRVNHGGRSKQGNQSGRGGHVNRGKPDNQDNQDNQGNQDDQGKQSIPAPAPDRAPNRLIEVGLNSGKTSIHIDVFRN